MGLFSKKPPCSICGGKISWFLPTKIEGEYICDTCFNAIDMETDKSINLTMQGLQEYLVFYDQNQLLKDRFVISEQIDFGLWDTKIIFDHQNKLFCMSKNPDKTVFEGKQLKSFTIKEDSAPLFEGSVEGIRRYASTVPEPFEAFKVELHFDHPYWTVIQCDMDGPRFLNDRPDVNDYLRSYQQSIEEIEKLVVALRTVAFPGAPEQSVGLGGAGAQGIPIASAPPADAIEEIKKYKALMEDGIISQQEFDAKKKQLLGI